MTALRHGAIPYIPFKTNSVANSGWEAKSQAKPKHASMQACGFASKVVVAPKIWFLPQESFQCVIPFADHDLPAAILRFVFVLAALVLLWSALLSLDLVQSN